MARTKRARAALPPVREGERLYSPTPSAPDPLCGVRHGGEPFSLSPRQAEHPVRIGLLVAVPEGRGGEGEDGEGSGE